MKRYFFPVLFLLTFVILPTIAFAETSSGLNSAPTSQGTNSYAVPAGGACPGGACSVPNPLGVSTFCGLVQKLLQASMAVGIPIAVLFIVYAGFKFVLAQGKPEALEHARKNFLWTLIGIGIFLGAWLLASVVANTINALGGGQNIISCN